VFVCVEGGKCSKLESFCVYLLGRRGEMGRSVVNSSVCVGFGGVEETKCSK
jgi:hypothetical protein